MTLYLLLMLLFCVTTKRVEYRDWLAAVLLCVLQLLDYHFGDTVGSLIFPNTSTNFLSLALNNLLCLLIGTIVATQWKKWIIVTTYFIGVLLFINEAMTVYQSIFYPYLNLYQTILCEGIILLLLINKRIIQDVKDTIKESLKCPYQQ